MEYTQTTSDIVALVLGSGMVLGFIDFIIELIVSIVISYAAALIARRDEDDSQFRDSKPPTLARRGVFCDHIIGTRQTSVIFAWSGFDQRLESFTSNNLPKAVEPGFHVLCVGPVNSLLLVQEGDEVIYDGGWEGARSEREDLVGLDDVPSFMFKEVISSNEKLRNRGVIYYGFDGDTPAYVSGFLADPSVLGVSSAFPYFCRVDWEAKIIDRFGTWKPIHYTVRRDPWYRLPMANPITRTRPRKLSVLEPVLDGVGVVTQIIEQPGQNITTIQLSSDLTAYYTPFETHIRLDGTNTGDGEYEVIAVTAPGFNTQLTVRKDIGPPEDFSPGGGAVCTPHLPGDDGANPGHALAELLFAPAPWGAGKSLDRFDLESFEVFSERMQVEGMAVNIRVAEGDYVLSIVIGILQDMSAVLRLDRVTGKYQVLAMREDDPVTVLDEDQLTGSDPAIESSLFSELANHHQFSFTDRSRGFKDETFPLHDDGNATLTGAAKPDDIRIQTTTSYRISKIVAERRSREVALRNGAALTLEVQREGKHLRAGDAFTVPQVGYPLRVSSTKLVDGGARAEIECYKDAFSIKPPTLELGVNPPGPSVQVVPVDPSGMGTGAAEVNFPNGFLLDDEEGSSTLMENYIWGTRAGGSGIRSWQLLVEDELGDLQPQGRQIEFAALGLTLEGVGAAVLSSDDAATAGPLCRVDGEVGDWGAIADVRNDPDRWEAGETVAVIDGRFYRCSAVEAVGGDFRIFGMKELGSDSLSMVPAGRVVHVFRRAGQSRLRRSSPRLRWKARPYGGHMTTPPPLAQVLHYSSEPLGKSFKPIDPIPVP